MGGLEVLLLSECLLQEPGEWKAYYLKITNRLGELSLFTGLEKEKERTVEGITLLVFSH